MVATVTSAIKSTTLNVEKNHLDKTTKNIPKPLSPSNVDRPHCFKRFIRYFSGEKSPLVKEIKKLAQNKKIEACPPEKINTIAEAFQSKEFSKVKKDLKLIISKMSDQDRETLFKTLLHIDFKKEQKILGNKCLQLMTLPEMRSLAKFVNPQFENMQQTAKEFDEIVETIKKYDVEESRQKLIKHSHEFILIRIIKNFIRTVSVAFNLIEVGKEPNTYFETKYMLDVYWHLIEIPVKIIKFIFSFIINPLIGLATVAIGTVVSAIALHVFKKVLRKCPEELPYCTNLTAEIKRGTVKPIFGRDLDLDNILNALSANNDFGRKHPLLIGKSGIGKTSLMQGLAWRFANGDVPESLKGKKLFYVNSEELKKNISQFSLKDPLEQIMHKVDGYQKEIILVFDEAHNLIAGLGERFNSILDTSRNSLFYAIGITTPDQYADQIETTKLDRRFDKIHLQEANLEQTKTILHKMNQEVAPDIKLTKEIIKHVFDQTNEKIVKRNQPDKSVFVMSQAFEKVRQLQNGGERDSTIQELRAKKESLASKLARKKLHALALHSEKIKKLKQELDIVNQQTMEATQLINEKKQNRNTFESLIKLRTWHDNWLKTTHEKIINGVKKGYQIPNFLEKVYLFTHFVLMPQLDKYTSDYAKTKKIPIEVTEEMINTIISDLSAREKAKIAPKAAVPAQPT